MGFPEFKTLERYSHEGYLIKVVVMPWREITRELSPIWSWSNNNYDLKLGEKARGRELHGWEATSHDTFPFARPAGKPGRIRKVTFYNQLAFELHNR